jgi:hypothetical protein
VADRRPGLLLSAVGLAGGVALACGAVMCARPALLFAVLFGQGYAPDTLALALLVVHFAALGCLTVIGQHLVAGRRRGAWGLWLALGAAGALSAGVGHTPRGLAAVLALPSVTLTTIFVAAAARMWARERRLGAGVGKAPVEAAALAPAVAELAVAQAVADLFVPSQPPAPTHPSPVPASASPATALAPPVPVPVAASDAGVGTAGRSPVTPIVRLVAGQGPNAHGPAHGLRADRPAAPVPSPATTVSSIGP